MSGSTPHRQNPARGYLCAVLAAAILSTTAIFIRELTSTYHMPALVLAVWRDVLVVVTLCLVLALLRPRLLRPRRRDLGFLAGYGLVLASFNATWTLSVAANGAAVATVLVYSSAAFTAGLGRWLLGERLGWVKVTTVGLGIAGCALVSGAHDPAAWHSNLLGIVAGGLSGLAYASYSLMGRSACQGGQDPWTMLLYTFGFATLFLLLANLLPAGVLPGTADRPADFLCLGTSWVGWGLLLVLAAGPTVTGFGIYNVALSHLPSSTVNLVVTVEPVFTAGIAWALLGEVLTGLQLAGSAMILGGVVFLRIWEGRQAGAVESHPDEAKVPAAA